MIQYVISVNNPAGTKLYFAASGGFTSKLQAAKTFEQQEDADLQLTLLASANTLVARYGQVEEV